ncbi:tetratricopeptide repeat protein [Amycolatopsis rhabdoformis]|uniref:non-specific serine/threonine protein kinase n=1 Tax=Amycolatopsis rhabdoformis TaxID=1448059 RepID=A0ABZ1IKK5_9PSEU|nr:tetratricopeptide repeat protein [Amycolatopsis rhabdoformis]WSE34030.1 tetratricopeptide repeat protein [Amycolatopsis rhabdoformis]
MSTACPREGCPGTIGRTGFCTECGWAPADASATVDTSATAAIAATADTVDTIVSPSRFEGTVTQQLAAAHGDSESAPLPVVDLPDVDARVRPELRVAEGERRCGRPGCGKPVGRSVAGQPARTEGFCGSCGTPFSFSPKLFPGDLVDRRYRVRGCLARGGQGFVYLGTDTRLGHHVALKGVLNTGDVAAARIARTESRFLTALDHPNVVRIHDVVTHPDPHGGPEVRYIVMEFVNGRTLREVIDDARYSRDPAKRLLVEHVVTYGRTILTALGYLHSQGLLYCDVSPQNVIHGERVKLIDFGAIRKVGDHTSPRVLNPEYGIDHVEQATHGLTVRSDLYAVGKTLRHLFDGSDAPSGGALAFGVRSLTHVLDRATGPHEHRFATAQEMAVQLDGVLGELRSLRDRTPNPVTSTLFAEASVLLDAGLGHAPPLEHWTRAVPASPAALPEPLDIARGLPVPRQDPDDTEAGLLGALRAPDAARLLRKLARATPSVEVELHQCRAVLALSEVDTRAAADHVRAAEKLLGARAEHDWRIAWHHGLVALADDDVVAAAAWFERVHRDIPGEEAPKLALGLCAEHIGGPDEAHEYHDALWVRDHAQVDAAFGLARGHLLRGDRSAAAGVLHEVPEYSRHDEAARIAGVRVLAGVLPPNGELPGAEDFAEAVERLAALELDEDTTDRLVTELRETALRCLGAGRRELPAGPVFGDRPDEPGLRLLLAGSYRRLARHAASAGEHGALIDRANGIRPMTWF